LCEVEGQGIFDLMSRTISGRLDDFSDDEDKTFVFINDFDEYEDKAWQCPKCGQVYLNNLEDIVKAQRRHDIVFHPRQQEVNQGPSASLGNNGTAQSSQFASNKIPPHIILRYAHTRAASRRNVSDFYRVLSEFYGIPVPVVKAVPTLGYVDGRKILGTWRGNIITFATSPSLHTILHEYFHYYSFVKSGGKGSQKNTTCKNMNDARKEEQQANDFANKCVIAFEQDFDFKEEFRDLAFKYHPDRGGNPRIFELVKTAYDFFVAPPSFSSQSYSYSSTPPNTKYQKQRKHSSISQYQSPREPSIVFAISRTLSFIVGIFVGNLLNLAQKSRSALFPSILRNSSLIKRITPKSIMFVIQMSILFADVFIIAFLAPGLIFVHYFSPSDYVMLQIGGALTGASTLVIGISKIHFR
jgi:hypothetical protein